MTEKNTAAPLVDDYVCTMILRMWKRFYDQPKNREGYVKWYKEQYGEYPKELPWSQEGIS